MQQMIMQYPWMQASQQSQPQQIQSLAGNMCLSLSEARTGSQTCKPSSSTNDQTDLVKPRLSTNDQPDLAKPRLLTDDVDDRSRRSRSSKDVLGDGWNEHVGANYQAKKNLV